MDRVTSKDIPSSLSDRLDSVMRLRAEETRRLLQEKTFKTYKYVTEKNIKDFQCYRRDADFISLEAMNTIKVMEGSTYMRLYIIIADKLNVMPCDIRLWLIESGEKTSSLRVTKCIDLEARHDNYIDHTRFYVQELRGIFIFMFFDLFLIYLNSFLSHVFFLS